MQSVRRFFLAHSHIAALICVAALMLRLLIPTGYMVSSVHSRIAITICSGVAGQQASMMMDIPMDHAMPGEGKSKEHGKAEMPCAFSALSAQVLKGADPVLLVAALAIVAALALRATPQTFVPTRAYLRPPLRGPPLPLI